MPFCSNCGLSISATATFCATCGAKVIVEAPVNDPEPQPAPPASKGWLSDDDWSPGEQATPSHAVPGVDGGALASPGVQTAEPPTASYGAGDGYSGTGYAPAPAGYYAGAGAYGGESGYADTGGYAPGGGYVPAYAGADDYSSPTGYGYPPAVQPAGPLAASTLALGGSSRLLKIWAGVIGVLILLGMIEGITLRQSVAGAFKSIRFVTAQEYASIRPGMTLEQVTQTIGTSGTQVQDASAPFGGTAYRWTNFDGSYVTVVFVNGVSATASESGLEKGGGVFSAVTQTAWSAVALLMIVAFFVVWGASLYTATLLRGYRLTVKQIVAIAAATSVLTLIPFFGWLLALLVMFAMIQWWTASDFIETLVIVIVSGVLRFVAFIPIGLGFWLALTLHL